MPLFPGFDTLGTLRTSAQTGYDYSWFVLDQKIIEREFALSGSEQNPDLTGGAGEGARRAAAAVRRRRCEAFKEQGADFIVRKTLAGDLVARMNARPART